MTKRKSKKATKILSKKPSNNSNNNNSYNNEIYNYICIGVIVIIIIFFICKEQINKNEGFLTKQQDEYNYLLKTIKSLQQKLMGEDLDFNSENDYIDFFKNYNKLNDDFINLQLKNKSMCIGKTNSFCSNNTREEAKLQTGISNVKTRIANLKDSRNFNDMRINDDYIEFNLSVPAKMYLKENQSIFYVYLRYKEDNIYGPIILISENQYKLLDINSSVKNYSNYEPIRIKIEDIANELFKTNNDKLINLVTTSMSSRNIHLYGVDQNNTTIIFNNKIRNQYIPFTSHTTLTRMLKLLKEEKIKYYKEYLSNSKRDYYDSKLNYLKEKYNKLIKYGIKKVDNSKLMDNKSSFYKELKEDETYKNIENYYIKLNTTIKKKDNIIKLKEIHKELKINEENSTEIFKEYNEKLDKIIEKYKRRKNAITKNQYKPSDYEKNAIRILGNNTEHFPNGIIDVGVFSLNVD